MIGRGCVRSFRAHIQLQARNLAPEFASFDLRLSSLNKPNLYPLFVHHNQGYNLEKSRSSATAHSKYQNVLVHLWFHNSTKRMKIKIKVDWNKTRFFWPKYIARNRNMRGGENDTCERHLGLQWQYYKTAPTPALVRKEYFLISTI